MFESSNPAITQFDSGHGATKTFTVQGAAFKTLILLACVAFSFGIAWHYSTEGYSAAWTNLPKDVKTIPMSNLAITFTLVGCIGGFIMAMIIIFNQQTAPFLSPIYATLEGLSLGAISAMVEAKYPGIVMQAMAGVVIAAGTMFALFTTGILRPTEGFVTGLLAAMVGILCLYFAEMILHMFGVYGGITSGLGIWSILIQGAIVVVASLCFIMDFGQIVEAAEDKAPKSAEWYAGFSILVTIVWLYIEILKLLMELRSND